MRREGSRTLIRTTLWFDPKSIRRLWYIKMPCIIQLMSYVLLDDCVPLIPPHAPQIIEINWQPPPFGWLQVNTNSVVFGASCLVGCADVFRSSLSFVKGCFYVPLGITYAFEVDLAAIIDTILWM